MESERDRYETLHDRPVCALANLGVSSVRICGDAVGGLGRRSLSNQLSVLGGLAILAVLFYLAKIGELRHPKTVVAAIAFLPIVLKNASMTIDFIPALAFLWWSYAMYRRDRLNLAAIFLGIACGFRPSSIVFMLPLLIGAVVPTRFPAPHHHGRLLSRGNGGGGILASADNLWPQLSAGREQSLEG